MAGALDLVDPQGQADGRELIVALRAGRTVTVQRSPRGQLAA